MRWRYRGSRGWGEGVGKLRQAASGAYLTALLFGTHRAVAVEPAPARADPSDATVDATPASPARPAPGKAPPLPPAPVPAPLAEPPSSAVPAAAGPTAPLSPSPGASAASGGRPPPLAARLAALTPPGVDPCVPHDQLELGVHTWVACGAGGVWVVELGTASGDRWVERRPLSGSAVGLFSRNGRVWVEVETRSAHPLQPVEIGGGATARPSLEAPPTARQARPPAAPAEVEVALRGRVLSARGGELVVDLGREHGVRVGNRIELATLRDSPLGPLLDRHVLAVGRVTSVSGEQSLVELGTGEEVPVGAEATLTTRELTHDRSAPPRAAGIWTFAGVLRPFFVLEQLGIGTLNELAVGYQFRAPLRVQLLASPLGFSTAEDGTIFSTVVLGLVSYDTRLFEIGFGAGAQSVNDSDYEPGTGLTLSQSIRFGSLDGLNLAIRNDVSLFHSEFEYSAFNGQGQLPITDRGWLVVQGGGGSVGHAFFEVGGKVLLLGNGTHDSLLLRGTIGYAALFERPGIFEVSPVTGLFGTTDLEHAGPLIGLGVEWRK